MMGEESQDIVTTRKVNLGDCSALCSDSVVWLLLVMFVGAVVREAKQPNLNRNRNCVP